MSEYDADQMKITPQVLLKAYACGLFPMAESADDPTLYWIEPDQRGVIPLDTFHVPRSLSKIIRKGVFEVRVDTDFDGVISGCAELTSERRETWINQPIRDLYGELFHMGFCHTVECWKEGALMGGLYGIHIGGAFFGESMFSRIPDASKVALVHLRNRLNSGGFTLLDTQFVTDHLRKFGAHEVPRAEYNELLQDALQVDSDFYRYDQETGNSVDSGG
ncbi:leucyl/phenylalanyl-tRNA--protein transferase [Pararhizobium sp. IMCC21322]|uniref:leucyl/phenylalanyl-tRNA--protein transferase n=1 Tax=Pararhizobium sp. IMCC21322 TaxID=3067903 RepID=UPI0027418F29|nr:leucyl/phenylalanyl-tRNA--protein transferase [Pararhizobium sp. IMCC21322]